METITDKVLEFKNRLAALYRNIQDWMEGSSIQFGEIELDIDEGESGHYTVPKLVLNNQSGENIARVVPVGMDIIGAEGQIHIDGLYDTRTATYFINGGPAVSAKKSINGNVEESYPISLFPDVDSPDWYVITDPRTGGIRRLDEEMFKKILAWVSDYGI